MFETILLNYFPDGHWTIEEGDSGWNNTTRYVEAGGQRWVLRVYDTHKEIEKVRFEHKVLLALSELELPYRVPKPVLAANGETMIRLTDGSGKLACLFAFVEGERPEEGDPEAAFQLGRASGQLSRALCGLDVGLQPSYPPYYEMDAAHPSSASNAVQDFCLQPPELFSHLAGPLARISEQLVQFRSLLSELRGLPHQLIHGDINCSNALAGRNGSGRLAAILDFEFATWDVRAMEFAVLVAGYLNDKEGDAAELGPCVEPFLHGAGSAIQLERREAAAIPLLVKLRMLDVFLHFFGRYRDGVDAAITLAEQIESVDSGLLALARTEADLSRLCLQYLCEKSV
ncbi:phosphotransferase [Cohnella soli]|uniref:Phosphotransferase n=1 Tax=Cohnella soli TaxID=425005 RepID=A0ABW0HZ54_9BACL